MSVVFLEKPLSSKSFLTNDMPRESVSPVMGVVVESPAKRTDPSWAK